jgi:hypothetical protein
MRRRKIRYFVIGGILGCLPACGLFSRTDGDAPFVVAAHKAAEAARAVGDTGLVPKPIAEIIAQILLGVGAVGGAVSAPIVLATRRKLRRKVTAVYQEIDKLKEKH